MNIHKNARSLPASRELMVARVEQGWTIKAAAESIGLSERRAAEWLRRARAKEEQWSKDRSSRPYRIPRQLDQTKKEAIIKERQQRRYMNQIASRVGCSRASVARVLALKGMSRPKWFEIPEPIVRYERERCGELLHLDIKRLARIVKPGTRVLGIRKSTRGAGYECVHVAIDDHSRATFSEVLPDQSGPTTAGFLRRAVAWFKTQGFTIERVLTDNGGCYRSREFLRECKDLGITTKRTRPYRPQTNGKAERMIQTLTREWAYRWRYSSSTERSGALNSYLHKYNYHRKHSSIGDIPPMTRILNNLLRTDK